MRWKMMLVGLAVLLLAMLACNIARDAQGYLADDALTLQAQVEEEAQEGEEPVGEPTATPTPAVTTTPSPASAVDECQASLADDEGDTVNGDTGEPYDEPAADATGLTSYCQNGSLGFDVMLASPDVVDLDMYSFAVRLMLFGPEEAELYRFLFQHHAGETTTSAVDSDTEESLETGPEINLLQTDGQAKAQFILPRTIFSQHSEIGAAARIFYMATSDGVFVTDETEILRLPDF